LHLFFFGTFVGVSYQSYILVQAGQTLNDLKSFGDVTTWQNALSLTVFAVLMLLPTLTPVQNLFKRLTATKQN